MRQRVRWRSVALRQRLGARGARGVILLYHRVAQGYDPLQLNVAPANFAVHLDVLARLGAVVPLDRLLEDGAATDGRRVRFAITFDDGYRDNLEVAAPLLAAASAPATVFVTPRGEGGEMWWDELARLLAPPHEAEFARSFAELRAASAPHRERVLERLRTRFSDASAPEHPLLTADEVARLAAAPGIEVGAHTLTHPVLSSLPAAEQYAEIAGSRERLAEILGHPPRAFAYPFGTPLEYDGDSVRAAARAGFDLACANVEFPVGRSAPRFELPRLIVRDVDGDALERRIRSLLPGLA